MTPTTAPTGHLAMDQIRNVGGELPRRHQAQAEGQSHPEAAVLGLGASREHDSDRAGQRRDAARDVFEQQPVVADVDQLQKSGHDDGKCPQDDDRQTGLSVKTAKRVSQRREGARLPAEAVVGSR
jgi:hypothetical protein